MREFIHNEYQEKSPISDRWLIKNDCPNCGDYALPSEGKHVAQDVDTGNFYEVTVINRVLDGGQSYCSYIAVGDK